MSILPFRDSTARPGRQAVRGRGRGGNSTLLHEPSMSKFLSSQFSGKAPSGAPGSWSPRERTSTVAHIHTPRARGDRFCSWIRRPISPGLVLAFPGAKARAGFPHLASAKVQGGPPHATFSFCNSCGSLWWLAWEPVVKPKVAAS